MYICIYIYIYTYTQMTNGQTHYICNTAYLFLKGIKVHKCHKIKNYILQ